VVAAVAIPLYYYRHRLVAWMEGRTQADDETPGSERPRARSLTSGTGPRTVGGTFFMGGIKPVNGVGMGSAQGWVAYFYFPNVCPLGSMS